MNDKLYNIYYAAEKKESKSRNGDCFKFLELSEEKIVVLCVSDGISSLSKDWLASEVTCDKFIENFKIQPGTINSRIKNSVLAAHSEVLTLSSRSTMASTLVTAVVDFKSNRLYYLSIGDSRIFIVDNENAKLITIDDSTSIPVKVNDSIIIKDGVPLFTHPITKAIGQKEKLEFEIHSYPFNPGESVVLATDGIHNHGMIPINILELLSLFDPSSKLSSAVCECSRENNDDATVLILRRNDFPRNSKSIYQDAILMNNDYLSEKLYPHLLTNCAVELVDQYIIERDWDTVIKCLEYIYMKRLFPSKDILISWLNNIVAKSTSIKNIIRKLIQINS